MVYLQFDIRWVPYLNVYLSDLRCFFPQSDKDLDLETNYFQWLSGVFPFAVLLMSRAHRSTQSKPNESIKRLRHASCHLMNIRFCQFLFESGFGECVHVHTSTHTYFHTISIWQCHSLLETQPGGSLMNYPLHKARPQCIRNLSIKMDFFLIVCFFSPEN